MIPARLERATGRLEICCSIQLSYGTDLLVSGAKLRKISVTANFLPVGVKRFRASGGRRRPYAVERGSYLVLDVLHTGLLAPGAAFAAFSDRNAQPEGEVHGVLLDWNPLRRMAREEHVGAHEEVDPSGREVHGQADGAAAVVEHGVAAREGEPVDRLEVDRSGDVVIGTVGPETCRVEQSEPYFALPEAVFDSSVEGRTEHFVGAFALRGAELEHLELEVGNTFGTAARDGRAGELEVLGRHSGNGVALAPVDESEVDDRQRCLQVGENVVCGAEVYGEPISCGLRGFHVDVVELERLASFGHVDRGSTHRDIEASFGIDAPDVLLHRDVEARVPDFGARQSCEELDAGSDVKPVVEQRERVVESRLEIVLGRDADVADVALLAELEELEERVGQAGVLCRANADVERPEVLAVGGVLTDPEDIDPRVDAEVVVGLEVRERLGCGDRFVEQRHEFPVVGVDETVESHVAAHGELDAAEGGQVEVAALRGEGRVELRTEGRSVHEVGRGVLGRGDGGQTCCSDEKEQFFHV